MTIDPQCQRTPIATTVLDLQKEADGWFISHVSIGPNNDPILLMTQEAYIPGTPTALRPRTPLRITHFAAGGKHVVDLPESDIDPLLMRVQPIGDHQWLLVLPRPDLGWEDNARIYDASGQVLHAFPAGLDLQHVQTTNRGQIWISYGDEGIFTHPATLGPGGLACVDRSGSVLLLLNTLIDNMFHALDWRDHRWFNVNHSHALNVQSDDTAWLYYFNPFPAHNTFSLVRIVNGAIDWLSRDMPVHYAKAFAVYEDTVLFAGSYEEPHTLFHVSLRSMKVESYIALDERGTAIAFDARRSFGRGSRLFLVTDAMLYSMDLVAL